jgi:hypothetical protein
MAVMARIVGMAVKAMMVVTAAMEVMVAMVTIAMMTVKTMIVVVIVVMALKAIVDEVSNSIEGTVSSSSVSSTLVVIIDGE